MKMNDNSKSNAIIDIKRRFLSECTVLDDTKIILRKVRSEPELENITNYDDICGPWQFHNVPLHSQYDCLPSKLITSEDVACMRKQRDKKLILLFLGKNSHFALERILLFNYTIVSFYAIYVITYSYKGIILHFRKKLFNDQQISTVIELIISTHNFFLANYWNTAEEPYKYFFEHLLLYTVMVIVL
ncbi:uncharacterized protein LOC115238925 [Formica exsecta]|uniref:uncharacterized protein LOC115238925 n=1 Tax=Formica exsecta TaxID=72781 RepID=UPI001143F285|nr:uncharacterized protein LOC115238925 [Formica exsecta]